MIREGIWILQLAALSPRVQDLTHSVDSKTSSIISGGGGTADSSGPREEQEKGLSSATWNARWI